MSMVERAPAVCSMLAGDFNIRDWEAHRAKVADDGGKKWQDAAQGWGYAQLAGDVEGIPI